MRPCTGVELGPLVAAVHAGWTVSRLRGWWSSVGRRCLIRAYPIKRVISDTLASELVLDNRIIRREPEAVGSKQEF
jgi:hypothetical protein